jgi:hypothetical protein
MRIVEVAEEEEMLTCSVKDNSSACTSLHNKVANYGSSIEVGLGISRLHQAPSLCI